MGATITYDYDPFFGLDKFVKDLEIDQLKEQVNDETLTLTSDGSDLTLTPSVGGVIFPCDVTVDTLTASDDTTGASLNVGDISHAGTITALEFGTTYNALNLSMTPDVDNAAVTNAAWNALNIDLAPTVTSGGFFGTSRCITATATYPSTINPAAPVFDFQVSYAGTTSSTGDDGVLFVRAVADDTTGTITACRTEASVGAATSSATASGYTGYAEGQNTFTGTIVGVYGIAAQVSAAAASFGGIFDAAATGAVPNRENQISVKGNQGHILLNRGSLFVLNTTSIGTAQGLSGSDQKPDKWTTTDSGHGYIYGQLEVDDFIWPDKAIVQEGSINLLNMSDLGSESLNEGDFATHTNWNTTGDFNDTGGNATYTDSTHAGTLTQPSGSMAVAPVGNAWYQFTYTLAYITGNPTTLTITTSFAASAVNLKELGAGTHTIYFKSAASPGDFVISATSLAGGATEQFTLDDLSLKRMQSASVSAGGDGLKIHQDGTVELEDTVWDDQQPTGVSVGFGASAPSFTAYNGNLRAYEFVGAGTTKAIHAEFQFSHRYKEGTDVTPHLHLHVPADSTGGGTVRFYIEYDWVNVGAASAAPASTSADLVVANGATVQGNVILSFGSFTGTGKNISSILAVRIYRDPLDAADTWAQSVWLKSLDCHFEIDTMGSRTATGK